MKYIPDNLIQDEVATNEIPKSLREIHQLLGAKWRLVEWRLYKVNNNWIAGLEYQGRHFQLVCDRGGIDIFDITSGHERRIPSTVDSNWITPPSQIYELLTKAVA